MVKKLMERGVYVTIAAYPSMPKKHGGLRINITRHLTFEDIDYLIEQLIELGVNR
jgi:7-keto-8-aminopelargonate synthetase-like enzyme